MHKVTVLKRRSLARLNSSQLVECVLRVGSQTLVRQSIEHPGCVVILPEIRPGFFLLVKQYRYAARDWLWEFPAGGVEGKETLPRAARRELTEETGYAARSIKKMISFFPTPGISEEKMHIYHACKLEPAYLQKDEDEEFELRSFSLNEIGGMIRKGKIVDGKTIIGYFLLTNL